MQRKTSITENEQRRRKTDLQRNLQRNDLVTNTNKRRIMLS